MPLVKRLRTAKIFVPEQVLDLITSHLEVPDDLGDLPEPHQLQTRKVISRRMHERAHHRLYIQDEYKKYRMAKVHIPMTQRRFDPFVSHFKRLGMDEYVLVHHVSPGRKLDKWMNQRQYDWKHHARKTKDDSRSGALRSLSYRNGSTSALYGAMRQENPALAADSAIAIYNAQIRGLR